VDSCSGQVCKEHHTTPEFAAVCTPGSDISIFCLRLGRSLCHTEFVTYAFVDRPGQAMAAVVMEAVDKYFKITERGSTLYTEFRAGTATFMTMCYILAGTPPLRHVPHCILHDLRRRDKASAFWCFECISPSVCSTRIFPASYRLGCITYFLMLHCSQFSPAQ